MRSALGISSVIAAALVLASACAKEDFGKFQNQVQFGLSFFKATTTTEKT